MDDSNKLKNRLLEVINFLLLNGYAKSKKEIADKIGVSASYFTELSKGRNNPTIHKIRSIFIEYPINQDWLLTGEGEMLKESTPKEEKSPQGGVTIPDDVWNVIKNQAESLKDQAASLESKDKQLEGVIDMLRIKEAQTSEMLDLLRAIHKKSQFAGGRPSAANSTVVEVEE